MRCPLLNLRNINKSYIHDNGTFVQRYLHGKTEVLGGKPVLLKKTTNISRPKVSGLGPEVQNQGVVKLVTTQSRKLQQA